MCVAIRPKQIPLKVHGEKSFAVELFAKGFGAFCVEVTGIHLCRAFRDSSARKNFFDFLPYPYQPPVELLFVEPLAIQIVKIVYFISDKLHKLLKAEGQVLQN